MKNKKTVIIAIALVILACLIALTVYLSGNSGEDPEGSNADPNPSEEMSGLDPEDYIPLDERELPDVVAVINGQEISKEQLLKDYQQMKKLYELSGIETDFPDAIAYMNDALISDMVSTTLMEQEADKRGIKISKGDVDKELNKAIGRFAAEEEFRTMLSELGMEEKAFRNKLQRQLKIATLMKEWISEAEDILGGLQFSDEDKRKMYEIIDAQLGGLPSYEDAEETVDQMLEYNKIQVVLGEEIQNLINSSEVDIRI